MCKGTARNCLKGQVGLVEKVDLGQGLGSIKRGLCSRFPGGGHWRKFSGAGTGCGACSAIPLSSCHRRRCCLCPPIINLWVGVVAASVLSNLNHKSTRELTVTSEINLGFLFLFQHWKKNKGKRQGLQSITFYPLLPLFDGHGRILKCGSGGGRDVVVWWLGEAGNTTQPRATPENETAPTQKAGDDPCKAIQASRQSPTSSSGGHWTSGHETCNKTCRSAAYPAGVHDALLHCTSHVGLSCSGQVYWCQSSSVDFPTSRCLQFIHSASEEIRSAKRTSHSIIANV